jgi:hypothetical protein
MIYKISCICGLRGLCLCLFPTGRSIITKKSDGSQVKESTDSSTTLEDDDVKGKQTVFIPYSLTCILLHWSHYSWMQRWSSWSCSYLASVANWSLQATPHFLQHSRTYVCMLWELWTMLILLSKSNVSCNTAVSHCSHR